MNKSEAQAILEDGLAKYSVPSYAQLKASIDVVNTGEVTGPSGTRYQQEYQAFWEDIAGGNVRVMASIDDGGMRSFFPIIDGFIKSHGGFVSE